MTLALLFPGQGTQHPEMLPWLETDPLAAPVLALLSAEIGADWRTRLQDPAWASDNRNAQILLTGSGIGAWQCLAPLLPAPAVIAGYSVGELPAFCAAGVFDAATALHLARRRALAMDAAVHGLDTGLLAVQGLASAAAIDEVCRQHSLALAIRMGADRALLGGLDPDLRRAEAELTAAGARCNRLPVRVASHTPWMHAAAQTFGQDLAAAAIAPPRATLVCNRDAGTRRQPAALRAALAEQIDHTVHWDACMDAVAERGVRCVLEVGPGNTLARLWNERFPELQARSADEFRSAAAVARWVRTQAGLA